ncbi:MAG: hypothetical protein E3J72_11385 [Planctomycetota bacterium]|nr:MAG: hypothetical protein E3J72_11385 [Planctomycetota bacterium]
MNHGRLIIIAMVVAVFLSIGCKPKKKKETFFYFPPRPAMPFPVGYGCIYDNMWADALIVMDDGSAEAGTMDETQNIVIEAVGTIDSVQLDQIIDLVNAAAFDFPDPEIDYGTIGTFPGYAVAINFDYSGEKWVWIHGESPPAAPAEYLALRDYLRTIFEQIINQ